MSIHTLRRRFVRDEKLAIQVMQDPYFDYFLHLYDPVYQCVDAYRSFLAEVEEAGGEKEFLKKYDEIKDDIIRTTSKKEVFQTFNEDRMDDYTVKINVTKEDIYRPEHHGKQFVSIDLKKANFHALRYYDPAIVDHQPTYEQWIQQFTDSKYMQRSKYIRQVIFGNLNPKKQVKIEKYIIHTYLQALLQDLDEHQIKNASHDEIVVEVGNETDYECVKQHVAHVQKQLAVPARADLFSLHVQPSPNQFGYVKEFKNKEGIEFKGVPALFLPQAYKEYFKLPLQDEDFVFYHEGYLAKLIQPVLSEAKN